MNKQINYPKTKKIRVEDKYFNNIVVDNYRWLEDDMSKDTMDWVDEQNKLCFEYLDKIPYRNKIKEQLKNLFNYDKMSIPFKKGDFLYYYKNFGLENQPILYRKDSNGNEQIFINPNTFSNDGTISLDIVSFSKDNSLVAYSVSEGGSDWRKIYIMNTATLELVDIILENIKFSGISWVENIGFYYSSYDKPKGSELSSKTDWHKVYFHKLGTLQSEDKIIYGLNENEKHRYVHVDVLKDSNYILITASNSTSGNKLLLKDTTKNNTDLIELNSNYNYDSFLIDNTKDFMYLVTNYNAPNSKLVKVDFKNPYIEYWADIIPETENVLNVTKAGNYFFANYIKDAVSKVFQYDYNGKLIREIQLPSFSGSASGFDGNDEKIVYFSFQDYKTPTSIFELDIKTGEYSQYFYPNIDFNSNDYESKQVFYPSKDNTLIPMIITYKKGTKLNSKNPTMLYGYGGFNISLTPSFSPAIATWLKNGGIYAVANLRGGGEYGKNWHINGTKFNKQNVFDDFIYASLYLIENNYTSSNYLSIRGGSNGGLLVGATMLQRPDLFKVALPAVGVLDMLRYHTFTAGAGWAYDYGTANDSIEMFKYLKSYSPVHNVIDNVSYPATLITTADHDDRVVPAHSFKFTATLQEKQIGLNPILIRVEKNAGHGAGTSISKTIEQYTDIFSFTLWNMGIKEL